MDFKTDTILLWLTNYKLSDASDDDYEQLFL